MRSTRDGHLLIVPGEAGQLVEVPVGGGLSIGSGEGADVQLPGLRPIHCRIAPGEGGYRIEGMAGTVAVNGKRQKATGLQPGDHIRVGRHTLGWLAQGGLLSTRGLGAQPKAGRPGAEGWNAGVWAVVALVLVTVAAGGWGVSRLQPRPQVDSVEEAFSSLRERVAAGQWEQALVLLDSMEGRTGSHPEWERYRAAVLHESAQERRVQTALGCAERGDRRCAVEAWEALDRGSLTFLKKGASVQWAIDSLPAAEAPQPPGDETPVATAGPSLPGRDKAVAPQAPKRRRVEPRGRTSTEAGVVSQWRQGRVDDALRDARLLEPVKGRHLVQAIERHRRAWDQARALPGAAAFPWLEQMVGVEKELGVRPEWSAGERRRLADLHVRAGRQAEEGGDWERALRQHRLGLEVWADHPAAREGIRRIEAVAERTFLEGYAAREIAPALAEERFRLVLRLLPEESPTRGKAVRWLGELTGPRGAKGMGPGRLSGL